MKTSRSEFHDIRGLRYHVRLWGEPKDPPLFLFHGWMDSSASFQFVVDSLREKWHVIAPDWRGFGLTARTHEGYWFPDYYTDLDTLVEIYDRDHPVRLVGHSMGGNIALTYAGICPQRVEAVVSLEGFGLARTQSGDAPARLRRWLEQLRNPPGFRKYRSFDELAARLQREHPGLDDEKAAFLARHRARETMDGSIELLDDPRHKIANPYLYRIEESIACWSEVTAPVLWVFARNSRGTGNLADHPQQLAERKGDFRNCSEAWIEDCGHMLHLDQPQRTAAAIEAFLRTNA